MLLPVLGPVTDVRALRGRDDEVEVITKHEGGAVGSMSLSLTSPPADRSAQWSIYAVDKTFGMPESDEQPITAYRHMIDELLAIRSGAWSHPCDVHFAQEVSASARQSRSVDG